MNQAKNQSISQGSQAIKPLEPEGWGAYYDADTCVQVYSALRSGPGLFSWQIALPPGLQKSVVLVIGVARCDKEPRQIAQIAGPDAPPHGQRSVACALENGRCKDADWICETAVVGRKLQRWLDFTSVQRLTFFFVDSFQLALSGPDNAKLTQRPLFNLICTGKATGPLSFKPYVALAPGTPQTVDPQDCRLCFAMLRYTATVEGVSTFGDGGGSTTPEANIGARSSNSTSPSEGLLLLSHG